ncbi:hypothetical protein BD779DRAFT_1521495 [Infundibulicybe gibba]|nr:hypothetical protein BD779DRAFT_1521495 [Infundibulicybe gibba]
MPGDCTCQSNCGACGPQGTGCSCPRGKCNCAQCHNKQHSSTAAAIAAGVTEYWALTVVLL